MYHGRGLSTENGSARDGCCLGLLCPISFSRFTTKMVWWMFHMHSFNRSSFGATLLLLAPSLVPASKLDLSGKGFSVIWLRPSRASSWPTLAMCEPSFCSGLERGPVCGCAPSTAVRDHGGKSLRVSPTFRGCHAVLPFCRPHSLTDSPTH